MPYIGNTKYKLYLGNQRVTPMVKLLPYDSEIEYLKTDGSNQYFNLGLDFDISTDAMEIYFQQTTVKKQARFFLSGNNLQVYINGSSKFAVGLYTTAWVWKQVDSRVVGTVKRKWKIDYQNKKVYVDDMTMSYTEDATTNDGDATVYMLKKNGSSPAFVGKCFGAKYWKDGVLVRDMIPVRVGNVGYMYDKVGKTLYGNVGEGNAFTLGRDVYDSINKYTLVDYVEHYHNSSTIDTRIMSNQNTRAVLDLWQCVTDATWQEPFAARTGAKANDITLDLKCEVAGAISDIYGNSMWRPQLDPHQRIRYDKDKGNTTITRVDDETVLLQNAHGSKTFNSNNYLWFGYKNKGNQSAYSGNFIGATFGLKIFDDSVLVRNYIPAIHPDGTCGLLDIVNVRFYASETNPFKPGRYYTYNTENGLRCIFFHANVNDDLSIDTAYDNLISSLIPVSSTTIKVKDDSVYNTTIIECTDSTIIKKGGQTAISEDSTGRIIELDAACNNIIVLLWDKPAFDYIPDFQISEVEV